MPTTFPGRLVLIACAVGMSIAAEAQEIKTGVPVSYQLPATGPLPQTYRVTLAVVDEKKPDWIISQFAAGVVRTVTQENGGKFSEIWDGLDDNFMPVPPGTYGLKGIFMPAAKWAVDGEHHSITPRYVTSADAWRALPGESKTPVVVGDQVNSPIGDVDVGANGVGVFCYQYLENARNFYMADFNKPINYDQATPGCSKVMQSRSVEFAKKFGVRFEVRNSMNTNPGTLVKEEEKGMEAVVVRGVSIERNQAKVTIDDVPDQPGVAAKIFGAINQANIVIDMIVQNVSWDGETDISFTCSAAELPKAEAELNKVLPDLGGAVKLRTQSGVAKLSIVGIGMRSHSGVAAKMFSALAQAGINIQMISTSEIKTAVTVNEDEIENAARVVHTAFGLDAA